MNDFKNSNYSNSPWHIPFYGVIRTGGTCKGRRYQPESFTVRIPNGYNNTTAIKKCQTREEAERVFLKNMPGFEGEIPYKDNFYRSPSKKRSKKTTRQEPEKDT